MRTDAARRIDSRRVSTADDGGTVQGAATGSLSRQFGDSAMKRTIDIMCGTLRVTPASEGPTILRQCGRRELCQVFAEAGFRAGAEVGVWSGHFSQFICRMVPGVHLRCVDPWAPYAEYHERKNDQARLEAAYQEAMARLAPYRCTVMRMSSTDAASLVPNGSLDFVYIDGNHERAFVEAD